MTEQTFKSRKEAEEATTNLVGWKTKVVSRFAYDVPRNVLYVIQCNATKYLRIDGYVY